MTIAQGILIGILVLASIQDYEEMSLPNTIPGFAFVVGVLSLVSGIGISPWNGVLGALVGVGTMFAIATMPSWLYYVFFLIGMGPWYRGMFGRPEPTLGGADIKITAAIGLFLGWKLVLVAILASYFAGAVVGIYGLFQRTLSRKTYVPFVPAILAGTWLAIFYGPGLVATYTKLVF